MAKSLSSSGNSIKTPSTKATTMNPAKKQIDETTYSGRFAARLRMLREKAGLTVTQAVEAIAAGGYSLRDKTYYAWENGQNQPPLDAFPAIAKAIGMKRVRDLLPME